MDAYHDSASQRNFKIIPLLRPRIEPAIDCDGVYVIRGEHAWLCGDRRQALREFNDLVRIQGWGRG